MMIISLLEFRFVILEGLRLCEEIVMVLVMVFVFFCLIIFMYFFLIVNLIGGI